MDKKSIQLELDKAKQRFQEVYGGEVVVYAAPPAPERKAWKRKPSLLDLAYQEELRKAEEAKHK